MKNIFYLLVGVAIVSTAPFALAQTGSGNWQRPLTNGVNTIGTMNGGGSGVGVQNPQPSSNASPYGSSVDQEPTRRPSFGDRGNIKYPSQGGNSNDDD
jgi:hypothetical protein